VPIKFTEKLLSEFTNHAFSFIKKGKEDYYFLLPGSMVSLSLAREITPGEVGKTFSLA